MAIGCAEAEGIDMARWIPHQQAKLDAHDRVQFVIKALRIRPDLLTSPSHQSR
jgi:hypothetical protein